MKPYMKAEVKYPDWYKQYASGLESEYPDYTKMDKQYGLYKRLSSLYTALDVVSKIGAPVKHRVKQRSGEELKDIPNHAWETLLDNPNPVNSGYAFFKNTIRYMMLGRAFWWMNATSDTQPPSEIWIIPSNRIAPVADGRMGIKGYLYDPGQGKPILLPPEQIIMFGEGDLLSPLMPFSPVETIAQVAEGDLQMQRWNTQLFRGNARLPGVMTFADMIQDESWNDIQKKIMEGADKRNMLLLRGVGQGGVNWIQGNNAPKDLEFQSGRKENRNEIWNTFAQGLVSMLSENATEANARTGKATLIDLVVYPMLQYIDSEVTAKVLPRYGQNLVVEPDDIRITDRVLELQEIGEYSKTHTVDEVRKKYWNDNAIGDSEIGALLVARAQTAQEQPQTVQAQPEPEQPKQLPAEASNPMTDINMAQEQTTTKAIIELDKWEKKSQKAGKIVTWHTVELSTEMVKAITDGKMTFEEARKQIKPDDAVAVLEGIRLAIEAIK